MKTSSSVKTIDRVVSILNCFSNERPDWSLAQLSEHLGQPKSSVHRFLVSLESQGILRRKADEKRWVLGYRLYLWGSLAAKSTGLRDIANIVMRDLVNATNETAILTVYQSHQVICIDKVETRHPVRLALEVGTARYAHAGASSKILMAYLPEEEIERIICEKGLPKLCTNTITDASKLKAELSLIRQQGYARSYEETDVGAWGVATPIRDQNEDVIAAVGVAGPNSRFSEDLAQEYAVLCKHHSARISHFITTGIQPGNR
jgi:DNA-binding IclR family transcriptional regulator